MHGLKTEAARVCVSYPQSSMLQKPILHYLYAFEYTYSTHTKQYMIVDRDRLVAFANAAGWLADCRRKNRSSFI